MKNNTITSTQFYFSVFLSTLVSLLLVDVSSSYQQIIYTSVAVLVSFLVCFFYKGANSKLLRFILSVYFFLTSVLVMNKFITFMSLGVNSGPFWILVIIVSITIFFCNRKGFEALTRAGVIISFFVVFSLIYVISSTVTKIELQKFTINTSTSILPALILLFPSVTYASLGHTIKDVKKYPLVIYSVASALIVGYFIFIASPIKKKFPLLYIAKSAHIGIFKGSDFLILAIITVAVLFFICFSTQCVFQGKTEIKYNILFTTLIATVSLICLYINSVGEFFNLQILHIIVSVGMLLAVIINGVVTKGSLENKICDKS